MAQIYVKINPDGKTIAEVSTAQQAGYIAATIDKDKMDGLLQWPQLCWLDTAGDLIHAENLPLTQEQEQLNKMKSDVNTAKQDVANSVSNAEKTVTNMQQTIVKLQNATMVANQKVQQMQNMLMKIQQASVTNQVTTSSASNQPTNNANSNATVTAK